MALHTMVLLAGANGEPQTARVIAERLTRSENHLSKVLQRLARAGFVSSTRGPSGGFILAQPAEDIIMLDVFEAMDGPVGEMSCTQTPAICDGQSCVFGQLATIINQQVREFLGGIRLSELELRGLGRLVRKSDDMPVPAKDGGDV